MEDHIRRQMIQAMEESAPQPTPLPSGAEMKKYIQRWIDVLGYGDKKIVGNIIANEWKRSALVWCNEGTIVNLDALPGSVIEMVYLRMESMVAAGLQTL